jgi:hypothetical protein
MLETRSGTLPIGTKAQANFVGVEPATANATIGLPGFDPVEITIRELKNFSQGGQVFNDQPVNLEFGTVPVPDQTIKIKLDGKTLGELDSDSVEHLKSFNYLKNGNPLKLKLTSISVIGDQAFVLGESPNGNLLKINKINFYDFKGQTFNDPHYQQITIAMPPSKTRDAVFLNGEPLGVLYFKKDKDALRQMGLLKNGELTPAPAILSSNFSVICAQIDPSTMEYPTVWTKEFQVFGHQEIDENQQFMIDSSAPILQKIKERPTILVATPEHLKQGLMGLAVDNHKIEAVTKWLTNQSVQFSLAPIEDVMKETKKGLAVFNLVSSSIPAQTFENMTKKFGAVIESTQEYQQKVSSLATRPQFLKPPDQPKLPEPKPDIQTTPTDQPATSLRTTTPTPSSIIMRGKSEPESVENLPAVTIDDLRNWYSAADKLGKPLEYKNRITEVANLFKSGQSLSDKALAAMNSDTSEYQSLSRLTQIAQRLSTVLGEQKDDGSHQVSVKVYDILFDSDRKDLTVSNKNGDIILGVQSGKVQSNKVTPAVIQAFEQANTKVDQLLSRARSDVMQL